MNTKLGLAGAILGGVALLLPLAGSLPGAVAQPAEIRIGNTTPYTGVAAAYGPIGRTLAAFFRMVNDQGGVNGRQVVFITADDGYNPARALEQTRRLVEQDRVLLIAAPVGTAANLATRPYLNDAGVPQLFVVSGAEVFNDPANYPWTMRWHASFQAEGEIYGRYIAANYPDARIGVLFQNDDIGADYVAGLRSGLGDGRDLLALPYDVTDPTVDAQVAALQQAGAEVFVNFATPRFAAQAIRRAAEIGWRPVQIQGNTSASVGGVMIPAGAENGIGNITAVVTKDPNNVRWADDLDMVAFRAFMAAYYPEGDPRGTFEAYAYGIGHAIVEVLRRCGDDLSRENVMRQAAELVDLRIPNTLPGVLINTGPTDYAPIEQFMLARFDGTAFVPFGELLDVGN